MTKPLGFPLDDDGMVLKSMMDRGVDLSQPRNLEFYCYAPNRLVAVDIADKVCPEGFKTEIFEDLEEESENKRVSVYFLHRMVPDYHEIVRIQNDLTKKLAKFDTYCDGWGTLSE